MISLQQLQQQIATDLIPALPTATITRPLSAACGHVLANDIASDVALPSADVSAMDGYALFAGEADNLPAGAVLRVIGESIAGRPFAGTVQAGECVRIMTGAVLPAGADSVIMQEDTIAEGETITLRASVAARRHIRYRGEEIAPAMGVLSAGTILTASDILLLASIGRADVPVFAPRKVAILSTGDELTPPGEPLTRAGQIYDSNRAMIRAVLGDLPVEIVDFGCVADDLATVRATLQRAAEQCDVVITSGGVSVGKYDFLKTAVAELGEIRQHKINIKPGKPLVYGKVAQAWYFGLPGNPVSGFVTLQMVIVPALWQLAGGRVPPALALRATLSAPVKKRSGRQDFQRGWLAATADGWQVTPQTAQDSHRIYGLARANCFIVLAAEDGDQPAGAQVTVLPFLSRFSLGGGQ